MKRIITIILTAAALLTSCQDEMLLQPAASLFSSKPEMTDTTAIFRLAVANIKAGENAITFPITFGGSAERGVDYTVSDDAFVFGGGSPVDSIVVKTLNLGSEKTLSLTVGLPDGFEGGKYLTSEYTLHEKFAYISFAKEYTMAADSADIGFVLSDKSGKAKSYKEDIEVFMSVNKEKSTAEEGVDFIFSDSTRFVIRKGEREGFLEIKSLTSEPAEGKDKIVFNLSYGDDFGAGKVQEMEVNLIDGKWMALDGVWKPETFVTDSLFMKEYWKEACSGYDLMPKLSISDKITISMEDFTFKPDFTSTFRHYFLKETDLRKGRIIDMELTDGSLVPVQTFMISQVNRYFDKTAKSEDTEAYIGMRLIPGETEEEQLLDLYLIDHTSKSFMPELLSEGRYAPEKPVAASPGLYLNVIFKKQ